jgi:hypothetical protein
MKPRRTPTSNHVFSLPGGNEDNDLWVQRDVDPAFSLSVWELDDEERAAIAEGGTVELVIFGAGHPPVSLAVGASLEARKEAT